MTYDFSYKSIDFSLAPDDLSHAVQHKTKMREWSGPLGGDALSGVDWDKVRSIFPYYSLRCSECNYMGGDYESNGQPRKSTP